MSRPDTVRALAPAKVNLWLEVLGRREDGFHEIRTWMLALDLCDRIEATSSRTGGVSLEVRVEPANPDVPFGRANLAWRGAEAALLQGRELGLAGSEAGVDLVLEKRIPSQAGLGGGSSDAAAAYAATGRALGLPPERSRAAAALSALGSDCVFFAEAQETGAARCEGRGERVDVFPAPRRDWVVAVLSPGIACPTAQVYASFDRGSRTGRSVQDLPPDWFEMAASAVRPFVFNRLEDAALEAYSELRIWRRLLDAIGADHWRLTGSGSSFFGLYDGPREAGEAIERVRGSARAAGIPIRGLWCARPARHGSRILELF